MKNRRTIAYTRLSLLSAILVVLIGCRTASNTQPAAYETIDYVTVGQLLETVETPYVIDLRNGNKRLVFVGSSHTRDTTAREFAVLEQYFDAMQPQIAFNEGGQIPASVRYASRNEAILKKGETGLLKYLSDQSGIRMLNGDMSDSLEFTLTLKEHPKDDLFLYYMMERLVVPYLNKAYGDRPFETLYDQVIEAWFVKPGFPLSDEEKSLSYFYELYEQKIGRPFVLEVNYDNFERFDYINGGDCKFCAIGRTSKMVRDRVLLDKIDQALDQYDRIIVTFGHGHALAIEPALRQLITKDRTK